jgi:hypothetical protein
MGTTMKKGLFLSFVAAGALLLAAGCSTPLPPGAERGPHNTMAYHVLVEASAPGARVEVNGEEVGPAPVRVKIFGDPDGTFHDFGSSYYVIRGLPVATNQYAQTRVFHTGHMFGPEDRIPDRVVLDMNQPSTPPPGYPMPPAYYYGPPGYAYPPYYYYGPSLYFGFGHSHRLHHHRHGR